MKKYKIYCFYGEYVLVPGNGIEDAFYKRHPKDEYLFETLDGIAVKPEFIMTCFNEGGQCEKMLDRASKDIWNLTFAEVKSIWLSRLPKLDSYWHVIRLDKQ